MYNTVSAKYIGRFPAAVVTLLVVLLHVSMPVVEAQEVPRMRSAVWIVNQYLRDRHYVTGTVPDVVVCRDGISEEWLPGIEIWMAKVELAYERSIGMADQCIAGSIGRDTLLIRSMRVAVDSAVGYIDAEVRYGANWEIRRLESYGAVPISMLHLQFTVERASSRLFFSSRSGSAVEAVWSFLEVRRHVMPGQRGVWVVVCDEKILASEINERVATGLRLSMIPVVRDPSCQIPPVVQEDSTRSAVMIDAVDIADYGTVITARVLGSARAVNSRNEIFRLMPDGTATLTLEPLPRWPPH